MASSRDRSENTDLGLWPFLAWEMVSTITFFNQIVIIFTIISARSPDFRPLVPACPLPGDLVATAAENQLDNREEALWPLRNPNDTDVGCDPFAYK